MTGAWRNGAARTTGLCAALLTAACLAAGEPVKLGTEARRPANGQHPVAAVERMPRLPEPLAVRDWPAVSREYYTFVLNPATRVDGHPLAVLKEGEAGFRMPSYVGPKLADEAMTCLAAVICSSHGLAAAYSDGSDQ